MENLINKLKYNKDVTVVNSDLPYIFIYQNDSFNIQLFNRDYIEQIKKNVGLDLTQVFYGVCKNIETQSEEEILYILFSGMMIIYDISRNKYEMLDLISKPTRSISDSISEPESLTGARDGFVENAKANITLIRSRVKDYNLDTEEIILGRRSKTKVTILSISDITNSGYKKYIVNNIKKIDVDAVLTMEDVTQIFQKDYLMPQYLYTGSPDLAVRNLYDGQILILIDNIPNVICLPNTITSFIEHKLEKSDLKLYSKIERIFQFIFIFLSTFMLGLLASFVTYQSDSLSLLVLSTLKITQKGVYLPIYAQIVLVLFLFELYYVVSMKSPKLTLSSMVVLVGGIIIGQNTITSGLVGVFIITMVALCFLSSFTISSNVTFILSISLVRMILLASSLLLGLFGFTLASVYVIVRIASESKFNNNYLYPIIPFSYKGMKKMMLFDSSPKLKTRPLNLKPKDKVKRK